MLNLEQFQEELEEQQNKIERCLEILREDGAPGKRGRKRMSLVPERQKRTLSAKARNRIAMAQRKRWAKVRKEAKAAKTVTA
jgi:hypothetical protein